MEESFGALLRRYRRAAGMSQRELAEQVGIDFSYLSKLENNRIAPPAADTIVAICKILAVDPEELLARTGKIPSDVQQTVGTSMGAQEFLREAQQLGGLTDEEWKIMVKSLHSLKGS
jgi:HTH-type transcriptional regulator, competence development regulator